MFVGEGQAQSSEINNVDDEEEMEVVFDTGAVTHVANPKHMPASCKVKVTARSQEQSFVAANGTPMANLGETVVALTDMDGNIPDAECTFQMTDVTRPLHAAAPVTDNGKEILIMQGEAVVVKAGTFSKFLKDSMVQQRYKRKGNLYMSRVKARPGGPENRAKNNANGAKAGFTRPGMKR